MTLDEVYGAAPLQAPQATKPAARGGVMSLDEVYGGVSASAPAAKPTAPAEAAPRDTSTRLSRNVKSVVAGAADLTDLGLVGLPAMAVGAVGDILNRLQGLTDSRSRREVVEDSQRISAKVGEAAGTPIRTLLTNLGYLTPRDETAISKGMDAFTSMLQRDAAAVEERSSGKILAGDYMSTVQAAFGALGIRGLQATGAGIKGRMEAKAEAKVQNDLAARAEADALQRANQSAPEGTLPTASEQAQAELTRIQVGRVMRPFGRPAQPPAAVDPNVARLRGEVAAIEAQRARGAGAPGMLPEVPPALRAQLADAEVAALRRGNQPALSPEAIRARAAERQKAAVLEGPQRPFNATLDSALTKTGEGKLFDLTPEERIALRGQRQRFDARTATAVAVGATGLGLAMAYEPDPGEAALAIGAGALVVGRGRGLRLDEIRALPDATPLGAIRDQLAVTTSTLEKLDGKRFDFSKQQVGELLKQQEVTAFERDLMTKALEATPGDRVTAKELVAGLKVASQDFELTPKKTNQFAGNGIANLNRSERSITGNEAWIPDNATPEEAARLEAEAQAAYDSAPQAATRIYQFPEGIEPGSNNHFGDPRYFGHTRAFEEGGVRHVVELQSDLAQKRVLSPAERATLTQELASQQTLREKVVAANAQATHPSLRQPLQPIDLKIAELEVKLAGSEGIERVAPALKNWHKRLIREEIADAARQGETNVRFATADTVAKVEDWADRATGGVDALRRVTEDAIARFEAAGMPEAAARERANLARVAQREGPRFSPEHQGIYDRYAGDVEKFLRQLGGKPYTDSAGHTWLEVPVGPKQTTLPAGGLRSQMGSADPTALAAITAIGGSALLASFLTDNEDNKLKNALATGAGAAALSLLILKKSSSPAVARKAGEYLSNVEDFAGNTSYQIEKISPPILRTLDNYKREQLVLRHDLLGAATPFAESLRRMGPKAEASMPAALLTGNWAKAIDHFGNLGVPEAVRQLGDVRKLLEGVGRQLKDSSAIRGVVDNYFPRLVTDLEGLLGYLGKPTADFVTQALKDAERKMGRPLDSTEASQVVNKAVENSIMRGSGDGSTFRAGRTIAEVRSGMTQFYAPPAEGLLIYLDRASNAIARAKFFGKHGVIDPKTGMPDLEGSIGNVLADEFAKGKMTEPQRVELARLMRGEFRYADQASPELIQTLMNLSNASLIGQIPSALANLTDTAVSVTMHGVLPTIKAVAQTLGKSDGRVRPGDLGLIDTISAELSHGSKAPIIINVPGYGGVHLSSAKFLDTSLKYSGFRALDQFGKQVISNAARNAARSQVSTPKGLARFTRNHAAYFGDDLPQLISDLKGPEHTPLTLEYLWRKVSDAQPLTSLDMPTARTANPTLRFAWQLQGWMLKQLTLLRKEGVDKIRKGDVREGVGFLARYSALVGTAGATNTWLINNLLYGQDDELSWGDIPMNTLKNFGISQYAVDQYEQRGLGAAVATFTGSPILALLNLVSGDEKAAAGIPIGGRIIYQRALGGAEKADEKAEKRTRREERQEGN